MDLTDLTNDQLADHIGAGLREVERRIPISPYSARDKIKVGAKVARAHQLLADAETIVAGNGGVSARSGGDKT